MQVNHGKADLSLGIDRPLPTENRGADSSLCKSSDAHSYWAVNDRLLRPEQLDAFLRSLLGLRDDLMAYCDERQVVLCARCRDASSSRLLTPNQCHERLPKRS